MEWNKTMNSNFPFHNSWEKSVYENNAVWRCGFPICKEDPLTPLGD